LVIIHFYSNFQKYWSTRQWKDVGQKYIGDFFFISIVEVFFNIRKFFKS